MSDKKNIVIFCLALIVFFNVLIGIEDFEEHKVSSLEFHENVLESLNVGNTIFTANDIYDLTKEKYHNELIVTEEAIKCLTDFSLDESSGSSKYFFAVKLKLKDSNVFYRVYGTDSKVFYISPMEQVNDLVKNEMQRLKVNCNFQDVFIY